MVKCCENQQYNSLMYLINLIKKAVDPEKTKKLTKNLVVLSRNGRNSPVIYDYEKLNI